MASSVTLINKYREKERIIQALQAELQKLEDSKELKAQLAFKAAIEDVMEEHGMTEAQLLSIFAPETAENDNSGKQRRKRTPTEYKNPHTGETIIVKGGRQKDYQEWIQEYGKETVQSWRVAQDAQ